MADDILVSLFDNDVVDVDLDFRYDFFTNKEMFQQTFSKLRMTSTYEQIQQTSQRILNNLDINNFVEILEKKFGLNPFDLHTEEDCREFYARIKEKSDCNMEREKNIASNKDNGER